MNPRELPIYELEPEIHAALESTGRVVLQAPTGSGKSTQVPQLLLRHGWLDAGQVVVLQPRRLATRLLARRVAEETGTRLGETVGYQIRFESVVSAATRIRFVTEGVLLRQITADPRLKGVSVLIFDEFHERHLYGDITLARALQIQRSERPDLKIVVMSATLETGILRRYLEPCAVLTSEGRSYPVGIEYLTAPLRPEQDPIWEAAASACESLAGRQSAGDILVFMPGAYEISRTVEALRARKSLRNFLLFPLHGELPAAEQDRAVASYDQRKIIVSTNVAETSLTIAGVTAVVDSGVARLARFDPHRGINTLLVEKISAASADQRAGRAGRTAPGFCLRLWTEREHQQRPWQEVPEVKRLDLAEVVLTLKASGIVDIASFPWIEPPESRALEQAERLLGDLGALDSAGAISALGRQMLAFPLHPRYARMLLAAQAESCVRSAALVAALTQGRNFLLRNVGRDVADRREDLLGGGEESDFFLLMRAWSYAEEHHFSVEACRSLGIHAQGARQVRPLYDQFLAIGRQEGLRLEPAEELAAALAGRPEPSWSVRVRRALLTGFSDQLARRLDAGTLRCDLVHGRKGMLARESAVQRSALLVAAEISEIEGRGGEVTVLLSLASAVEEAWLPELFGESYAAMRRTHYDATLRRVMVRQERSFRGLVLEDKETGDTPPAGEAAALLAAEMLAGRCAPKEWDESVERWIVRVNRLAEWFPELEVAPLRPEDRRLLAEQICYGAATCREVRERPVWPALRAWLSAEQLACLDSYLPERLDLPSGRKVRIAYPTEGPPVIAARIQDLYGVEGGLAVGHGRVPLRIEVLAPNQRPIQVTDNLAVFWKETYPRVKQELQRRYPRHLWR